MVASCFLEELPMDFFKRNARFIIPLPWALLSAENLWEAVHGGDAGTWYRAIGFGGLAYLFYAVQRHIHAARLGA
jgi:hypothetical protein